ncbi:MAG: hypothetical protein KDA62_04860 [Planctomycetales bacterium]|nr:hypothetical protein [Planctomycetales bacterium]
MSARLHCLVLLLVAMSGAIGRAESPPDALDQSQEIAEAIRSLDAELFADRQAASSTLQGLGKHAIPALEAAASSDSAEVRSRSVEVLAKHAKHGTAETRTLAEQALDRLTKSDRPAVANLAKQATQSEQPDPNANPIAVFNGMAPIRINPAQIQVQMQAQGIAGGVRRTTKISKVNGVKTIEVEENDRKIKVVESAKGLEVELTKKQNGKETTEKFQAKDLAELKKKHPEAAKAYDEVNRQGGIQIQINGGAIGPAIPARQPAAPPQIRDALKRQVESLKRIEKTDANRAALERSIQRLEEQIQRLGG